MSLTFNPNIDFEKISHLYSGEQRIQLQNVWLGETANAITTCLSQQTEFINAYTSHGQNSEITESEITAMSEQEQQQFYTSLYQDAYQGIGFLYGRHEINEFNNNTPQLLKDVYKYLNSEALLEKIRILSGLNDINSATLQATRYTPGNYLTRHNDINEAEGRKIAFEIGFTPKWHPDWGGLLQFYQQNGTPKDAWAPNFNSMTLYDVSLIQAVTFIAPFSIVPRYSISGWFNAK